MHRTLIILAMAGATALAGSPALATTASAPSSATDQVDPTVLRDSLVLRDALVHTSTKRTKVARGPSGNTLRVSKVRNLPSGGSFITVSGSGFNETVGIYVGLCRTPRKGVKPSPCGGGVDTTGRTQASAWISSNPPPYGQSLAKPYGRGGTFKVRLYVRSQINSTTDCRRIRCSIVTRADHLRSSDRRWDLAVPVRFR
jgi:hypothetical protein